MQKLICTIFLAMMSLTGFSQATKYVNPKFYNLAKNHKNVAVIPFDVIIGLRPKERETITPDQLKEMEVKEGISVQHGLASWFLRKRKSKPFDVEFQDVQVTNALLTKAGIDATTIKSHTPQEIADILGVDAVIGGLMKTTKPMSEGASVALGMAIGFWGSTNSGDVTITLTNGSDGVTLWKYSSDLSSSLGSDMDTLIDGLMRRAARNFPYMNMDKYEQQAKKK